MKKFIHLLAAGFLLGAASCSRPPASTPDARLKWNLATLVDAYEKQGHKNPKWDESAKEALTQFAHMRADQWSDFDTRTGILRNSVREAVAAGCDDPLIEYLACRFTPPLDRAAETQAYVKAAEDLKASDYPAVRKFYATLRASEALKHAGEKSLQPESYLGYAYSMVLTMLGEKTTPPGEIYDACLEFIQPIKWDEDWQRDYAQSLEKPLLENWSATPEAHLIRAEYAIDYAWAARGGGYANAVRQEQWDKFFKRLGDAETALKRARELAPNDPRVPNLMLRLALSQQKDRPEMERWFQEAMRLNTNNYSACENKLQYLSPKWYGTRDEMLKFGRECIASNWGGRVPLILVDAHYQCANLLSRDDWWAYWKQPDVWPDIQSSYEKFFAVNPDAKGDYRYYYARYAFWCGQPQSFAQQINLIRQSEEGLDPGFFGGQKQLDEMLAPPGKPATKNGTP